MRQYKAAFIYQMESRHFLKRLKDFGNVRQLDWSLNMCKEVDKNDASDNAVDISIILEKSGRYQIWQYFLGCLPAIFVSMLNVNFVFVAGDVEHRCRVSECESPDPVFSPAWWPDNQIDACYRPILNNTIYALDGVCTNNSFTGAVEKCTDLLYESNDTAVSELNLGCEPRKVNFVGTMHGVGSILAVVVSGWMCDRFGRKPTLIIGAVSCVIGNFKVLAKSYSVYIFIEFLEGAMSLAVYTAGPVIMSENSNTKTRIMGGVLFAYAVYMGEVLFACIAMSVPYWKNLLHIICSPPILFLSYIFIFNESPRWQIINGKLKEARKMLKQIVKWNKLEIKTEEIDKVSDDDLKKMFNVNDSVEREGLKELLKSRDLTVRLIAGTVWRLSVSFIYYSLVVNSVFLPGNKYTNFLLTALTSFPGELLSMYLMNKFGRKKPLMAGFLICGATSIASAYVPESYTWMKIVFFLFGKLLASACFTASVVYTMELFPTSVRGSCTGICSLAACAGTMLAPLTPALTVISPVLSSFCIASFAVVAFALLFSTPETKGVPLPDTIEQVIAASQKENNLKINKEIRGSITDNDGRRNHGYSADEINTVY